MGRPRNYRILGKKNVRFINRSIKKTLPIFSGIAGKVAGNVLGSYGGPITSKFGGHFGGGLGSMLGRSLSKRIVNTKIRGWSK